MCVDNEMPHPLPLPTPRFLVADSWWGGTNIFHGIDPGGKGWDWHKFCVLF